MAAAQPTQPLLLAALPWPRRALSMHGTHHAAPFNRRPLFGDGRKPRRGSPPYRPVSQVVNLSRLWQTVGMTKKREFPQHREDRKVQKLVERIIQQQALQAKSAQEQDQALPPRS
jgi:hypothetical protein